MHDFFLTRSFLLFQPTKVSEESSSDDESSDEESEEEVPVKTPKKKVKIFISSG